MILKQLSVFLENKSGRLYEVFDVLGRHNINVFACSVADTSEFGILRMIVSDDKKALKVLREKLFSVNVSEVVSFATSNIAGALAKTLKVMSDAHINIEYIYGLSVGKKSYIILRSEDVNATIDELQKHKITLISINNLY